MSPHNFYDISWQKFQFDFIRAAFSKFNQSSPCEGRFWIIQFANLRKIQMKLSTNSSLRWIFDEKHGFHNRRNTSEMEVLIHQCPASLVSSFEHSYRILIFHFRIWKISGTIRLLRLKILRWWENFLGRPNNAEFLRQFLRQFFYM